MTEHDPGGGVKPSPGTIGIPATELSYTAFWQSLLRLVRPKNTAIAISTGHLIPRQRNLLAANARGEWLLFLDSDMVFPENLLERLLSLDADIASAPCILRVPPHHLNVWLDGKRLVPQEMPREPFECEMIGMAATLIRQRVLDALAPPWFEVGKFRSDEYGEDTYFCKKARDAGFRIMADPTLRVWHLAQFGLAPSVRGIRARYGSFDSLATDIEDHEEEE